MFNQMPWFYPYSTYNELLLQPIQTNNYIIQQIKELAPEIEVKVEVMTPTERTSSTELPIQEKKRPSNRNRRIKKKTNDTKNIPKNFGKAIMCFILKKMTLLRRLFKLYPDLSMVKYLVEMKELKNKVGSISDLRNLWSSSNQFCAISRILSNLFLRQYSLNHIYNSRITNFANHVKYRYRMMEALRNPDHFKSIKEY